MVFDNRGPLFKGGADETLSSWAEKWHAAFDADADVTTYGGVRL